MFIYLKDNFSQNKDVTKISTPLNMNADEMKFKIYGVIYHVYRKFAL